MCEVVNPHTQDHDWSSALALLLQNKGLQVCNAWKLSEQPQFPYRTGVICGVVTPKGNVQSDKNPLQNDILVNPGKKLHFAVKKNV